jgi:hypothetical protein
MMAMMEGGGYQRYTVQLRRNVQRPHVDDDCHQKEVEDGADMEPHDGTEQRAEDGAQAMDGNEGCNSAVSRALSITELLEHILACLDAVHIQQCRRVCRTFQKLINSSPTVQRKINEAADARSLDGSIEEAVDVEAQYVKAICLLEQKLPEYSNATGIVELFGGRIHAEL